MPIYAYRCTSCGHTKDLLRKLSDPPLTECPSCGKPTFVKQVTAAGFQLKGSGWYATDFKGNGAKKPADSASTDGSDSAQTAGEDAKKGEDAKAGDAAAAKPADSGSSGSGSSDAATSPKPAGGSAGD